MFLILQYSTLKSTVVQYNSWHTGAGIELTGKKSYWLEEGEEVGDGRAEGLSAIGDGGQAAISLTPDVDGTGSGSLLEPDARSHLWKLTTWRFICRGFTVFFYFIFWLHHVAYRIVVPQPGIQPGPQQWKCWVLTTGPLGNSLAIILCQKCRSWKFVKSCSFQLEQNQRFGAEHEEPPILSKGWRKYQTQNVASLNRASNEVVVLLPYKSSL